MTQSCPDWFEYDDGCAPGCEVEGGSDGWVRVHNPMHNPAAFELHPAAGGPRTEEFIPVGRNYTYELRETTRCIQAGVTESPTMPLEDTVATMRLFDGLRDRGVTIIYATHDLQQALRSSSRAILLNNSVIADGIQLGTPSSPPPILGTGSTVGGSPPVTYRTEAQGAFVLAQPLTFLHSFSELTELPLGETSSWTMCSKAKQRYASGSLYHLHSLLWASFTNEVPKRAEEA